MRTSECDWIIIPGICLLLAVITWVVFGQTLRHEFINYDDYAYVVDNPEVTKGLTRHGIGWAFTHPVSYNWHPLTVFSHMLDCQLHGLKAGWHHATNVMLHMLAVLLLFLVLQEMTGALWRSAFVAALFAIHPLHVESVAWVAERKDVLSGFFFMLTLGAYNRYVRKRTRTSYLLVGLMFALGLMSKPMLVTVPFLLLLLDYWPLGRLTEPTSPNESILGRPILEKFPLLLLSGASCVVTFLVQGRSVSSIASLPVWVRVYQACVSSATYVYQMFWPNRLAVFYPYPTGGLSIWPMALAFAVLIALTAIAIKLRKQRPYLFTGWFWYVGMLVPVMGIVQVGIQAHADRYTYLPHIGLYLLITWVVADLSASWRYRRQILGAAGVCVIVALGWSARTQTACWKDSESLWRHALAVTRNNPVAHDDLGKALEQKGMTSEAISHFRKAVELWPDFADAYYDLGAALFREGQLDEAISCWQKTVAIRRDHADAYANLGRALARKRQPREAIAHFEKSLELAPRSPATLNDLAWVLSTCPDPQLRNGSRAIQLAERADKFAQGKNPLFARTLAAAYAETGRFNDAITTAERALPLAAAKGDSILVTGLRLDLDLYRINLPVR